MSDDIDDDEELSPNSAQAFLEGLSAAHPGPGNYTPLDRYRDFRSVFLSTEQGKRVLYEILGFGHMFRSLAYGAKFETNRVFYHEGERNLALRIVSTINIEPKPKPDRANSTK